MRAFALPLESQIIAYAGKIQLKVALLDKRICVTKGKL